MVHSCVCCYLFLSGQLQQSLASQGPGVLAMWASLTCSTLQSQTGVGKPYPCSETTAVHSPFLKHYTWVQPLLQEHPLGLLVGLLLVLIMEIALLTPCPATFLPGPVLLHQVLHLTEGPSVGGHHHSIECDVSHPNTSMLAMVTKEKQVIDGCAPP